MGRTPDQELCERTVRRVCDRSGRATSSPYGNNERCLMLSGRANCRCALGARETSSGCELTEDCAPGACDPLSKCTIAGSERACSPCPTGYIGSGARRGTRARRTGWARASPSMAMWSSRRWGHYLETPAGEVYVFERTGERWLQTKVLRALRQRAPDYFGASLVLTPSGSRSAPTATRAAVQASRQTRTTTCETAARCT